MKSQSRTSRSALNAGVGVGTQIVTIGLSFAARTVFVAQLGTDILGVQTLLMSVLAMLAVADLGLSGALMFALYKPLSEGDESRVSAIVRHGARYYRYVASLVALAGLSVMPFLEGLVRLDNAVEYLHLYFLILLADSVAAYLMVNRVVLATADQRLYRVKIYTVAFASCRTGAQIVALVVWQSFLVFLVLQVVFTVLNNGFVYWRVGRMYPYLAMAGPLDDRGRREIARSVRSMLVYRVGGLVLHNTDPILISVLIGTATLGLYANYLLLVGAIVMVLEVVFAAASPGVGHLVATEGKKESLRVLDELTLAASTVYGMVCLVLIAGLDAFIEVWLGPAYVMGWAVVAALALNVYVVGIMAPIWSFRGATGMFHETQYVFMVTAVLNVLFSVALAGPLGVPGILLATALSRLLTGSWFEPRVLLARHLDGSFRRYLVHQLKAAVLWGALGATALLLQFQPPPWGSWLGPLLVLAAAPLLAWSLNRNSDAFMSLRGRAFHALARPR
jgi:O-antigen/teichoic acid export membrane protein